MATPPTFDALPEDWQTALFVVAHPDDIEYGGAAAVARWTGQGKRIVYCMVTSGEAGIDGIHPDESGPLREAEEIASAARSASTRSSSCACPMASWSTARTCAPASPRWCAATAPTSR